MSDRTEQFSVGREPRLEVRIGAGDVHLVEGDQGQVGVRASGSRVEELVIEQRGDTVVITQIGGKRWSRSVDLTVRLPAGAEAECKLGSADLSVDVALAGLRVGSGAGDIRIGTVAGPVAVASGAGDIALRRAEGRVDVSVASGDVRIGEACDGLNVKTASGDIRVDRVEGRVGLRTASGDFAVERFEGDELSGQSLSGDIRIGIPPGRRLQVDVQTLSGDVRNDFGLSEPGEGPKVTASLRVKTLSGDVNLHSAR